MEFVPKFDLVQVNSIVLIRFLLSGIIIIASCAALKLVRTTRKTMRAISSDQTEGETMSTSGDTASPRADDINQAVTLLLDRSRASVAHGEKNDALASLLHAIRLTSGEASILGILSEAKKRVDEAHAQHSNNSDLITARQALQSLLDTESILGERDDILHDAFNDGSSVICKKCGALVPRARADIHSKRWCPALPTGQVDDDDGSDV